jgi:hypothetical protein
MLQEKEHLLSALSWRWDGMMRMCVFVAAKLGLGLGVVCVVHIHGAWPLLPGCPM